MCLDNLTSIIEVQFVFVQHCSFCRSKFWLKGRYKNKFESNDKSQVLPPFSASAFWYLTGLSRFLFLHKMALNSDHLA